MLFQWTEITLNFICSSQVITYWHQVTRVINVAFYFLRMLGNTGTAVYRYFILYLTRAPSYIHKKIIMLVQLFCWIMRFMLKSNCNLRERFELYLCGDVMYESRNTKISYGCVRALAQSCISCTGINFVPLLKKVAFYKYD